VLSLLCLSAAIPLAYAQNGTLVCWSVDCPETGMPTGTFSAVAAAYTHSVGIRPDGTLLSRLAATWARTALNTLALKPAVRNISHAMPVLQI
jgi:hypothetical protein